MRFWVGLIDNDWFRFLRERPTLEEVNFWQPSGGSFGAIPVGAPFLFKLHYPFAGSLPGAESTQLARDHLAQSSFSG